MGWLTGEKKAAEEKPTPKETPDQRQDREFAASKELAPEYVAKIEANRAAQWQTVQDELAHDRATYSLSAVRHGDFLMLSLSRWGYVYGDPENVGRIKKSAVAVNLSKTDRIITRDGTAPNQNGKLSLYHVTYRYGDEPPIVSEPRDMFEMPAREAMGGEDRSYYFSRGQYDKPLRIDITGLAQFAVSDTIQFVGADTTLSVPFGMAVDISAIIFKAIKDGYEPPASSVLAV